MLQLSNVSVSYGPIMAVRDVSIEVQAGELVTIVGPNGAGKSSLLRAISGLIPISRGKIVFTGHDIKRMAPHQRVGLGLVQVPEGRAILQTMTIHENLQIALEKGRTKRNRAKVFDEVLELFPILRERAEQEAGTLSGGEQQMLALARALVARPSLLLLDEPSLGLAPLMIRSVFAMIEDLRRRGVSILLVEQNVVEALRIADRGYLLELGSIVASGPSRDLARRSEIMRAYLGTSANG